MEGLRNQSSWSGSPNIENDPKHRLTSRHAMAFEDLGSSFYSGPSKKRDTEAKSRDRASQHRPSSTSKSTAKASSPDSDDPMDTLSSSQADDSSSCIRMVPKKDKESSKGSAKAAMKMTREQEAQQRSAVLKQISFKKKKDDSTPKAGTAEREHNTERVSSPSGSRRPGTDSRALQDKGTYRSRDAFTDDKPSAEKNAKPHRPPVPPTKRLNDNPNVLPSRSQIRSSRSILGKEEGTSRTTKPSRSSVQSPPKVSSSEDESWKRRQQGRTKKKPDPFPISFLTASPARPVRHAFTLPSTLASKEEPDSKTKVPRTPVPFPTISPVKKSDSDDEPPSRSKASSRTPAAFPPMPPVKTLDSDDEPPRPKASSSRTPAAFPNLSPVKGQSDEEYPTRLKNHKGKDKASNKENNESNRDLKSRENKPRDFPMNSQMLKSIDYSTSPIRPGKRISERSSSGEHTPKKLRQSRKSLDSPPQHHFDDEGDSIYVDPKTLCPYCDTPLPTNPSPLLLKILEETRKKAHRDPRPSNPRGLKAPLTVFISACQRHRFESKILPEAERKGWPKSINWKSLGGRVIKMRHFLQALIEDPGNEAEGSSAKDEDWEVVCSGASQKKGAKSRSAFWTEIMDEVKRKGLRAVSGVRGQFANFEKAQPGYYGETGSVIIHQTLYNMFPLGDIDPTLVAPLTANEFVQRILVPEVALHLIMEDNHLSGDAGAKEALAILRDSSAYGVAMFPEDGGEWGTKKGHEDKIGVGDLIVMERARKRRKELEEEDKREEEQRKMEEENDRNMREREERRARRKAKADALVSASSDTNDPDEPPKPPRPRPRPRALAAGSSSSNIAPPPSAQPRGAYATRSRSRSVVNGASSDASESDIYGNENSRASSVERQRSPSASETRNFGTNKGSSPPAMRSSQGSRWISESESSTRAELGIGRRAPSKARSTAAIDEKRESSVFSVKSSDSDDIVEILNTPMPKRRGVKAIVDENGDQDTPKAVPVKGMPMRPLDMAKLRKLGNQAQGSDPTATPASSRKRRAGKYAPTVELPLNVIAPSESENERNAWLLQNPSSQSQESKPKTPAKKKLGRHY